VSRYALDAIALCRRAPNAKAIAYGADSTRGPVDIEDRVEQDAGGERLVRRTVITIATSELAALVKSVLPATVYVEKDTSAEVAYRVRDIQLIEDGELRELICAEAD
jgi:hypothetical protein